MKIINICLSLSAVMTLCACGNSQSADSLSERPTVAIVANIGKAVANPSRYAQESDSAPAEFKTGDAIGVFMNDDEVVQWTFGSISWETNKTMYWDDWNTKHSFYAFYPYPDGAEKPTSKDDVPMPSLEEQDGSWKNIAAYDFLVASHELSYQAQKGIVNFTEENAFKHVSALLKITLKNSGDMIGATIHSISISGKDLIAPTSYSFETGEVSLLDESTVSTLTISPNHETGEADASFYFIVNGIVEESETEKIDLNISYTSNGVEYTAERTGFAMAPIAGRLQDYNIVVKSGEVIIQGGGITNWTPGEKFDDIIINGDKVDNNDTQE